MRGTCLPLSYTIADREMVKGLRIRGLISEFPEKTRDLTGKQLTRATTQTGDIKTITDSKETTREGTTTGRRGGSTTEISLREASIGQRGRDIKSEKEE